MLVASWRTPIATSRLLLRANEFIRITISLDMTLAAIRPLRM